MFEEERGSETAASDAAPWRAFHAAVFFAACLVGCKGPSETGSQVTSSGHALTSASAASSSHTEEDCTGVHSPPHPPLSYATALNAKELERLTTLRISAHVGSVFIRKRGKEWFVSGQNECLVPAQRMGLALKQLVALTAVRTDERPLAGNSFELQIVALAGEERMLHFDVADRSAQGDLVQLPDYSAFRVQGLERTLWSAHRDDWCREP